MCSDLKKNQERIRKLISLGIREYGKGDAICKMAVMPSSIEQSIEEVEGRNHICGSHICGKYLKKKKTKWKFPTVESCHICLRNSEDSRMSGAD